MTFQPRMAHGIRDYNTGGSWKTAERERPRSGRRLTKLLVILLTLGALAGTALGAREAYRRVLRSAYFQITEIRVEGNLQVATDDVIASLKLAPAASLLEQDLAELSRRAMRNPWIKDASVVRRLPGWLAIQVVERTPEAVFIADRRYLLSADGVVLRALEDDELPQLPVLRAAVPRKVIEGEHIVSTDIAQGLSVWRQFQVANAVPQEKAHEIVMGKDGSYAVNLGPNMPVIRLRPEDMPEQLRHLGAALAASGRGLGQLGDVDLRFQDRVVFRLAAGR
jgi:cell division septal protein FtsQ